MQLSVADTKLQLLSEADAASSSSCAVQFVSLNSQHMKEDAADLIKGLLKYNPNDRLSLVGKGTHSQSALQTFQTP